MKIFQLNFGIKYSLMVMGGPMKFFRGRIRCFIMRLFPFMVKSVLLLVLVFGNTKMIATIVVVVIMFSIVSATKRNHVSLG
jgi:hypothetical protein